MKQIRKNLFETNSSSTHVITIANNSDDDFKNNLPETIEFNVGEYGWEFERYDDMQSRANYLFTGVLVNGLGECIDNIRGILKKWNVEAIFPELEKIKCGYSSGYYYILKDEPNKCFYIDHSSELEDFIKQLCDDETFLMNYLFSPESFIATGNDNDDDETLDDETNAKNILMTFYKGN